MADARTEFPGDPTPLCQAFFEGAGRSIPWPSRALPVVEAALGAMADQAVAGWSDLSLDRVLFVRHVGERLASNEETLDQVQQALSMGSFPDTVRTEDLYLACACAQGDSAAIRAFERRFVGEIQAVTRRFAGPGRTPEDLRQILMERLFVSATERPPRIADYRGTGSLQAWLRVTAVRAFLDEQRRISRREKDQAAPGEALLDLPAEEDWELGFLKAHYRSAFREAFGLAVRSLDSEQRNLLRNHTVEGLTLDQIAALYGAHRSSVHRRLQAARQALLVATREALAATIQVEAAEFDSIMGLIQSRLDVSVARLLAPSKAVVPNQGTRDDG